jgi:putative addiction module component (TIGR02574 family)
MPSAHQQKLSLADLIAALEPVGRRVVEIRPSFIDDRPALWGRTSGGRCSCLGSTRSTEYIPPVNLVDLEKEALKLPVGERARLAEILLESLDTLSEDEHRRLWAEEAARRDAELDADPSMGRSADEVFRDARARLR